eukprot:8783787-Pyramimonas_sp.AAC.1
MLDNIVQGVEFQVSISERAMKTWKTCKIVLMQEHEKPPPGATSRKIKSTTLQPEVGRNTCAELRCEELSCERDCAGT